VLFAATIATNHSAIADDHPDNNKLTIAVFGDWPYNQNLLTNAPLLINSVNSDPDVSRVIHVGDIHSGSFACTSAGILPPIPTSNPGWNQTIYFQFQQFKFPFVYTLGDNEWTDCHKTKEFKSGAPLNELASVRSLFFARPGKTLGLEEKDVLSQAKYFDPAFPADAQFVENVIWEDAKVVFVTVNLPGSNNDTLPWTNGFETGRSGARSRRSYRRRYPVAASSLQASGSETRQSRGHRFASRYVGSVRSRFRRRWVECLYTLRAATGDFQHSVRPASASPQWRLASLRGGSPARRSDQCHGLDPQYAASAEFDAHHGAGFDEQARRVAAPDHRHPHAWRFQLEECSLLQRPADQLPIRESPDRSVFRSGSVFFFQRVTRFAIIALVA
jgi:hypothetical protein